MPRESLHTLINMLEDFGVFDGRKVTIEVSNGIDVKLSYDPPLGENGSYVREQEAAITAKAS